jgi:tetratricopeptide (TPR) repeat protein
VPWFYLSKALLPINLTVFYPKWEIDSSRWISYVPGMILIGCLMLFWRQRRSWGRPFLFGLGVFVVMLFPVSGFFDQNFYHWSLVADHWQYYSIIAVIALVVAASERICRRLGEQGRQFGAVAGAAVLMVLGVASWKRIGIYATNETLWRDNVAKNPDAWLAHYDLGAILVDTGRLPEAIWHFERVLQIEPDCAEAHYGLGTALGQAGKFEEAIEHFQRALQIKPDYADAHYNLGSALGRLGRLNEAIGHFQRALQIKPDYAEAHNDLGNALLELGRVPEAIGQYEQALWINPDYAAAKRNLAHARSLQ